LNPDCEEYGTYHEFETKNEDKSQVNELICNSEVLLGHTRVRELGPDDNLLVCKKCGAVKYDRSLARMAAPVQPR
jgi:hypothetical protein